MCLILFEDPNSLGKDLQELPKHFEKDPIQFLFIAKGDKGYQMKRVLFGDAQAVIYKPKR